MDLELSAECLGWVQLAGYRCETVEGDLTLYEGAVPRYFVRRRPDSRVELREFVDVQVSESSELLLFAARVEVLERFVFGLLGDDIRADLDLPFLDLSWSAGDVADGYVVGELVKGFRTLSKVGGGPVAASRGEAVSLSRLVPLSHFLSLSVPALKASFLDSDGRPLLANGGYARRR